MNQPAANSISRLAKDPTHLCDAFAVVVLAVVGLIAALTFRDYGLGWDDYTHAQYGNLLVSLFSSGFTDKRALSFVNLYMYGGGFDVLAALAAKILPFGLFETRRLVGAAVGLVGLLVTWRLGRRLGGPFAGLAALVLLAACPLYFGHMFINAKDGPFAVTSAIALLGIVRAFEEYPRAYAGHHCTLRCRHRPRHRFPGHGWFCGSRCGAAVTAHSCGQIPHRRPEDRARRSADCF